MSGMLMAAAASSGVNVVVPLPGGSASQVQVTPVDAVAGWRFNADGTVDKRLGSGYTFDHRWHNGTPPTGAYTMKATYTSGNQVPSGSAVGSAVALPAEWRHSVTENASVSRTATITVEVLSGVTVISSGSYVMTATVLSSGGPNP